MKYKLVVCGGTFDHFHKGHREFLRYALSITERLLVGLTSNKYIKSKDYNEAIEDFEIRKSQLINFFTQEKATGKISVESIDDIFIPKAWEHLPIEAIVVNKNTVSSANKINSKRNEQGNYPLNIEIEKLIKSDDNEYISSSSIRSGKMDREGRSYIKPLWLHQNLILTEELREKLKKPFGELIKEEILLRQLADQDDKKPYLITVGDVTTETFNKLRLNQNISVIDFKVARQRQFFNLKELGFSDKEEVVNINNPAGSLTPDLFKTLEKLFKKKNSKRIIIQIDGEEDLAVLPVILTAPLGAAVYYGQPNQGLVKVEVSEESKSRAYKLTSRFSIS